MVSHDRALQWLERWDHQQEFYIPDREERFQIIIDIVEESVDRPDPLVVDLGVGPGSLSTRLLDRLPEARVVGVDADPLLLGLAEAAYASDRFRVVNTDIREPAWFKELELDRAPDAFVSTTALHWLNREPLRTLITTTGREIAPGGVFVDGDHLYEGVAGERLDGLGRALTKRRITRVGAGREEDWLAWWRAIETDPELADLVEARGGGFDHTVEDKPTVHDYIAFLREAGYAEAGTLWQVGDDRIVVGLA